MGLVFSPPPAPLSFFPHKANKKTTPTLKNTFPERFFFFWFVWLVCLVCLFVGRLQKGGCRQSLKRTIFKSAFTLAFRANERLGME